MTSHMEAHKHASMMISESSGETVTSSCQTFVSNHLPNVVLKVADHPLGLLRDVDCVRGPDHGTGPPFVLSQTETYGLVLSVCSRPNKKLTFVPVFSLFQNKDTLGHAIIEHAHTPPIGTADRSIH